MAPLKLFSARFILGLLLGFFIGFVVNDIFFKGEPVQVNIKKLKNKGDGNSITLDDILKFND